MRLPVSLIACPCTRKVALLHITHCSFPVKQQQQQHMAPSSLAKPFFTTTIPQHSRRNMAASTTSPPTTPRTLQCPTARRARKPPPPPPLLPPPQLPSPTTTSKNPHTVTSTSSSSATAGDVLRLMDVLRLPPDEDLYISLIRGCTDAAEVAAVHAHITTHAHAHHGGAIRLPLANRLLLTYAAGGNIEAARQLFDEMPVKNSITWATMVAAYSDSSRHHDAMRLFARMVSAAPELFGGGYIHAAVAALRSCARAGKSGLGEQIHAFVVKNTGANGSVCGDVGSSLVQLYCALRHWSSARRVLEMMRSSCPEPVPQAAWTSVITACHQDGLLHEAVAVFRDMAVSGIARNSFSLSSILAVCAETADGGKAGRQAHTDAIKHGVDSDQFVGSGLVHMYAKQGQLVDAARAFEAVGGTPDAVCWNAMLMAYARGGWYREAMRVLYEMKAAGMQPSERMINEVKMACFR